MTSKVTEAQGPGLRRTSDGKAAAVERLIEATLAELGYDIVRVLIAGDRRPKLQLMIERKDERPLDVEDCARASRAVEAILDVEDPIAGAYVLEVSSPGLDRPLTRLADFDRFAGQQAKVELFDAAEGRRRFTGRLIGTEGTDVKLETETEIVTLPFTQVQKAKLVLTDELIAAYKAKPTAVLRDDEDEQGV